MFCRLKSSGVLRRCLCGPQGRAGKSQLSTPSAQRQLVGRDATAPPRQEIRERGERHARRASADGTERSNPPPGFLDLRRDPLALLVGDGAGLICAPEVAGDVVNAREPFGRRLTPLRILKASRLRGYGPAGSRRV